MRQAIEASVTFIILALLLVGLRQLALPDYITGPVAILLLFGAVCVLMWRGGLIPLFTVVFWTALVFAIQPYVI